MKVTCICNDGYFISLVIGKTYEVLDEDAHFFRLIDETGEDYLYPKALFIFCSP